MVHAETAGRRVVNVDLSQEWGKLLRGEAAGYASAALASIRHEFPAAVHHTMTKPGDFPYRPRARTPVFYGSFDWHSSVEMHWALVRLLRTAADAVPAADIRAALGAQFTPVGLAAEADFVAGPGGQAERPHGWAWALALIHETATWDDPDARKWAAAMAPLADALTGCFLDWLGRQAYPVRHGTDGNSAFGLSRVLPFADWQASSGKPALLKAITAKADAWFANDSLYPADWEPSGDDCLSPALTQAELMSRVLPPDEFAGWLAMFLPGIEWGRPGALFTPAVPPDADSQAAHLHGLNASRAWCWRRIAGALPPGDARVEGALAAARQHATAVLPHVLDSDYAVAHWLASYAVLMLS
ncbi:MAG: hypothetical protein QOJ73_5113 [Streptosporangiaceae bacterium]|jgi:hypothetical protein|nr:hypothetical protein [Streptosporangiaceae bacterium]